MIQVPSNKPHIPASVAKEASKEVSKETQIQDLTSRAPKQVEPKLTNAGRGPEMDTQAIAVKLAAMATEAKEKEKTREFKEILQRVIELTGIAEPEAAMAEANRRLQEEIDIELQKIKADPELMEEAEDWQKFAELLASLSQEQAGLIISLLQEGVKELT